MSELLHLQTLKDAVENRINRSIMQSDRDILKEVIDLIERVELSIKTGDTSELEEWAR